MAALFPDDQRGGVGHVLAGRIPNSQRKGFALGVGRGHGRAVDSDAVLFGCGIADGTGEVHRLTHAQSLRRSLRRSRIARQECQKTSRNVRAAERIQSYSGKFLALVNAHPKGKHFRASP